IRPLLLSAAAAEGFCASTRRIRPGRGRTRGQRRPLLRQPRLPCRVDRTLLRLEVWPLLYSLSGPMPPPGPSRLGRPAQPRAPEARARPRPEDASLLAWGETNSEGAGRELWRVAAIGSV